MNRIERSTQHPDPARSRHASRRVRDGVSRSMSSEAERSGSTASVTARASKSNLAPGRFHQLLESVASHAGNGMIVQLACAHVSSSGVRGHRDRRARRSCSPPRFAVWRRVAGSKRRSSSWMRIEVFDRVASGRSRDVDQVQQHLRALDMTEKAIAEAMALVRPLDQAGHVGHHEAAIAAQAARRQGWARAS